MMWQHPQGAVAWEVYADLESLGLLAGFNCVERLKGLGISNLHVLIRRQLYG